MPATVTIIAARYAGTCTATGKRYPAGTRIQRGAKGWEIACTPAAPATCRCGAPITQAGCDFCDECATDFYRGEYPETRRERYQTLGARRAQSLCTYCEAPTQGTVCNRCARACGESDDLSPDFYGDGYDRDDYGDDHYH